MAESIQGLKRTHMCGEVAEADAGKKVVLMGWVHRRRDHGGLIFVDLRDRTGLVQVVFSPEEVDAATFRKAEAIRSEYVAAVVGEVRMRPEGTVNENLKTGKVEVYARELRVLNESKTPPFTISDAAEVEESVRLRYRYLDLRREELQQLMTLRHKIVKEIRDFFDAEGFNEIETPILNKSTPEGARDYLVPSRTHPGEFFALPQSPQLFKQILMVAGMDRYFQMARCFRDEDLRADRQPEFTQLDVEMSFITEQDIMVLIERMMAGLFKKTLGEEIEYPFARMTYDEAMARYGSDKPDTRFGLELVDISETAAGCGFKVFSDAITRGGCVRGINAKGCGGFSRKEIDELTDFVSIFGAKGLAWMVVVSGSEIRSPIAKFFDTPTIASILKQLGGKQGDLLLFVADTEAVAAESLGGLRLELARKMKLVDPERREFVWVTDFPLVQWDAQEQRWDANHHPFTSPRESDLPLLETDPAKVRAQAYDLVLNGVEIGGGSIRIHRKDIQERVFALLGLKPEEVENKFGFMLEAFEYGAPPHGGIALGLDRIVMLMAGKDSIRDCIAFPKTQNASCLMTGAPSGVPEKHLQELGIRVAKKGKDKKNPNATGLTETDAKVLDGDREK